METGDLTSRLERHLIFEESSVTGETIAAADRYLHSHQGNPDVDWSRIRSAALARFGDLPPQGAPYWSQGQPLTVAAFWAATARGQIASDPRTPPQLLAILSADPVPAVSSRAQANPSAPVSAAPPPVGARQRKRWPVALAASLITGVLFGLLVVALVSTGLGNAYSFTVVDQEARAGTFREELTGRHDLTEAKKRICGGDEDYLSCLNQHVTLYNTVCADQDLTEEATQLCSQLDDFVDSTRSRYRTCGSGCRTQVDSSGQWGWPYLNQVPETTEVSNGDALPEISHVENCYFSLGPVRIGNCPGEQ